MLQKLNFPKYNFRLRKTSEGNIEIFDVVRKKFLLNTPEEWVRQHALHYLIEEKKYPLISIELEKKIIQNSIDRRFDLVSKNNDGSIKLLLECKAPNVKITQATFDQINRYNNVLQSEYLWITNGLTNFFFKLDKKSNTFILINDLHEY